MARIELELVIPPAIDNLTCPRCERPIPHDRQRRLHKPKKYADDLNDVIRCGLPLEERHALYRTYAPSGERVFQCGFIFSPKGPRVLHQ